MVEKKEKEIIGYYTDDRNIYCVECINKDSEMMKKLNRLLQLKIQKKVYIFAKDVRKKSSKRRLWDQALQSHIA